MTSRPSAAASIWAILPPWVSSLIAALSDPGSRGPPTSRPTRGRGSSTATRAVPSLARRPLEDPRFHVRRLGAEALGAMVSPGSTGQGWDDRLATISRSPQRLRITRGARYWKSSRARPAQRGPMAACNRHKRSSQSRSAAEGVAEWVHQLRP